MASPVRARYWAKCINRAGACWLARRKCRPRARLLAGVRAYGRRKSALTLRLKRRHVGRTTGRSKPYTPSARKPAIAATAPRPNARRYGELVGDCALPAGETTGETTVEMAVEMAVDTAGAVAVDTAFGTAVDDATAGVVVGEGASVVGTMETAVAGDVALAAGSGTLFATARPAVTNSSGAPPSLLKTRKRNW